jgi:hypothetical protein
MTCPNCGHVYPIFSGIPNMVRLRSRSFVTAFALIYLWQLLAEHEIGK